MLVRVPEHVRRLALIRAAIRRWDTRAPPILSGSGGASRTQLLSPRLQNEGTLSQAMDRHAIVRYRANMKAEFFERGECPFFLSKIKLQSYGMNELPMKLAMLLKLPLKVGD